MPPLTEEQNKAIASINEHVLVSAGAGSGKTFVLVERYIQVLAADEKAGINDIIAVTYTRKAAEEMRSRLKARLKELASDGELEKRGRWLQCLSELETARIGTIHSLCESILKNYPSEAGIDPGFEILDDLERAELLAESIDQSLHLIIEKPREYFAELLEYPIEGLRIWLTEFLRSPLKYKESRKRFGDCSLESMETFAVAFIKEDVKQTVNEVLANKQFVSEYSYLKDTAWADRQSKLGILQDEMLSYLNVLFDHANYVFSVRFQALQALGSMESAKTAGGPSAKELRTCMRNLRAAAKLVATRHKPEINEADKQAFVLLRALIMLTDDTLYRYELLKQQHQKLDFDDLIERSQLLLSPVIISSQPSSSPGTTSSQLASSPGTTSSQPASSPGSTGCQPDSSEASLTQGRQRSSSLQRNSGYALKQISKNLRAVLVDEFQDTNWTQAKLLTALASAQGKLFLIGDDKQSIYKFQGADVGTFNACKTYVSSLQESADSTHRSTAGKFGLPLLAGIGQQMTLSQSFRSHPQIVNFVNYLFRFLFNAEAGAEEYKSRFQALRPARDAGDEDENPRIDIIYTAPVDEDNPEHRSELEQMEAQLTADWILDMIRTGALIFDKELKSDRPINFSDFAILLQANSDFAVIERALAKSAVPYVSIAGSGFLYRQEILDLENILKWLVCPQDSHALFAVLRSPMFGFSDDLLHDLKAGKSLSLWQCLNQKVKEGGLEDLQKARQVLQNLQRESGILALPDLLRKVVLATGYDMVLLCTEEGKQKSRNVFKFLALANQLKHMGISEFLKSLSSMRELGVKNLTDAPLCADNAVKIMTIHKSKGLEFAAVALPRIGRAVYQQPDKLLFGKDLGIALDCTRDRDEEKPAFFVAANNLSRRMDEEEKKRLLYVALTRARDYIGIFVTPRSKRSTNFAKWMIEALGLPEADGVIEKQVMSVGKHDERCSWKLVQSGASWDRETEAADKNRSAGGSPAYDLHGGAAESRTIAAQEAVEGSPDYSLLDHELEALPQTFTPVPWQVLLRACPADQVPTVHATIAGNYFHLLMSKLGPELHLPAERDRRALLLHHEISVHDPAQQELLLQESERLLITFKNSNLYPLLKTARRRIEESAYLISRADFEEELRPDLIFEDKDGAWHIVDYKTDHFELRQMPKQVTLHQPQLARYVEDLQTLLGVKAKAWIYFAQTGRLEAVDISQPVQLSLF